MGQPSLPTSTDIDSYLSLFLVLISPLSLSLCFFPFSLSFLSLSLSLSLSPCITCFSLNLPLLSSSLSSFILFSPFFPPPSLSLPLVFFSVFAFVVGPHVSLVSVHSVVCSLCTLYYCLRILSLYVIEVHYYFNMTKKKWIAVVHSALSSQKCMFYCKMTAMSTKERNGSAVKRDCSQTLSLMHVLWQEWEKKKISDEGLVKNGWCSYGNIVTNVKHLCVVQVTTTWTPVRWWSHLW